MFQNIIMVIIIISINIKPLVNKYGNYFANCILESCFNKIIIIMYYFYCLTFTVKNI